MDGFGVVASFLASLIGTGIVANWLVQKWQYRNWLNQQQFLGSEKKFQALKAHVDEFADLSANRLSAMFRLLKSFDQNEDVLNERLKIYNQTIDAWNSKINIFYARTTMYINFAYTKRIEDDINGNFVQVGALLERAVRSRREKENISELRIRINDRLNSLQGKLGNLNRDFLRVVINQQSATYYGVELLYNTDDLPYFSNWQLFKALFISRVEGHSVILTSHNLELPSRRQN